MDIHQIACTPVAYAASTVFVIGTGEVVTVEHCRCSYV